jgi:hypothetical protein
MPKSPPIALIYYLFFWLQMHKWFINIRRRGECAYQASSSRATIPPGFCKKKMYIDVLSYNFLKSILWGYNLIKLQNKYTKDIKNKISKYNKNHNVRSIHLICLDSKMVNRENPEYFQYHGWQSIILLRASIGKIESYMVPWQWTMCISLNQHEPLNTIKL